MNRALCHCSPAYGALMHALPRDASALKRMTEMQMFNQAAPWVDRVPHATERELDTWTIKAVNPQATGLGDLGDLAELDGLRKKLKKVAKKIAAPIKKVVKAQAKIVKKVVKAQVKVVKKAAKSKVIKKIAQNKIVKKIARPLAYAVGAATGTLAIVAKADQIRTAARKVRAKVNDQKAALKAQFAIAEEKLGIEPAQPVQEPAPFIEPVEQQAAPEPMVYNEPEEQAAPEPMQASFAPVQQSFAPIQQAAPRPQRQAPVQVARPTYQAPVQVQRQQAAPEPMVYDEPEPQYQAPQQSFAPSPFYPQNNPVTRLPTADEAEEQPRVVGLSAAGIMDNIKANPLPWVAGAAVAAYLVTNRKTSNAK